MSQITPGTAFYWPISVAMDITVRTERDPATVIAELGDAMREASQSSRTAPLRPWNRWSRTRMAASNWGPRLLEIFGGMAPVLCIAGIYGLLAYLVTQGTRELGIRLALRAQRVRLMAVVLRQTAGLLLCALCAGLMLAYVSARLLRTLLYGLTVHDPSTIAAVTLMLLVGGLAATYLPAQRASSIDPVVALRSE